MSPTALTVLLTYVIIHEADLAGLKASELVIERVTGPPPSTSHYLSEDSGAKVRRINRKASPGLYLLLNVTHPLPNSTGLVVRLFEGHNNAYKSVLAEYKRNFCDYLINEKRPLLRTLKDALHIPPVCPVQPGIYKIDNWQVSKYMPPILPLNEAFKIYASVNFETRDNIILNLYLRLGVTVAALCGVGLGEAGVTRSYELIIEQVTGSPPTKSNYLSDNSGARVRKKSRNSRPGLLWVLNATREFPNNTVIYGHLFEGHNNAFKATLIDYRNNFCRYLESEKMPIFRITKDALKLPDKCPFGPGYYKTEDWRLDERLLPPFLPGGDRYMLQMGFEFTKNDAPHMNVFLKINRKKKNVLGR